MASFREDYYSHVDDLFSKLRDDPFQQNKVLGSSPQELDLVGSIQPVGWVRNASPSGSKSIEINTDGISFWTASGQRTVLSSSTDWGEIQQQNIDGSNDTVYRLLGESTFESWFAARLSSDTNDRARIGINSGNFGVVEFGSGSATPDVNLYRSAANILKTDDSFQTPSLILGSGPITAYSVVVTLTAGSTAFLTDANIGQIGTALFASNGNNGGCLTSWYRNGTFNGVQGISWNSPAWEFRGSTFSAGAGFFSFYIESNLVGARLGIKNNAGFTTSIRGLVF